jgi:hypothetical protein
MTKTEALEMIAAYESDPDGFESCDNLCTVLDGLDCGCTAVNTTDPKDVATARWANRTPSFCARENAIVVGR